MAYHIESVSHRADLPPGSVAGALTVWRRGPAIPVFEPVMSGTSTARAMRIAVATAVIVLPLFAPQPLVGAIAASLHFPYWAVNTPATLTLLGHATGRFLLTPMIDLFEVRRRFVTTAVADAVALSVVAVAPSAVVFPFSTFIVDVMTSSIQMLVPMAAMLVPEARRGGVIGSSRGPAQQRGHQVPSRRLGGCGGSGAMRRSGPNVNFRFEKS